MTETTRTAIMTMARMDGMTEKQLATLKNALADKVKIEWVNSKTARAILGEPDGKPVSRPYFRKLVEAGLLHPRALSERKIRYDQAEVQNLLRNGGETMA